MRHEVLVNYTDIPLMSAMKEVVWLGKNVVPDRRYTNMIDKCEG